MIKQFRKFFQIIIVDIFNVLLITFLVFFFLEDWLPGLVTNYIRLEILLLLCLLAGLLAVLFGEREKIKKARWLWAIGSGGLAVLFILPRVVNLGGFGYLIAVVGGLAAVLVVYLVDGIQ